MLMTASAPCAPIADSTTRRQRPIRNKALRSFARTIRRARGPTILRAARADSGTGGHRPLGETRVGVRADPLDGLDVDTNRGRLAVSEFMAVPGASS
jgi:hypothetical protein